MAGEKSGSLAEVLDRFITYQKLSLAVRKKVMVSLMYPCVLIVLVILLMVFLVTYVVPDFRRAVHQHAGEAAGHDGVPDRDRHHGAELYRAWSLAALVGGDLPVPLVGADAIGTREDRPREAAACRCSAKSGSSTRWRSSRAC